MTKRMREIKSQIEEKQEAVDALLKDKKFEDAEKEAQEIENMTKEYVCLSKNFEEIKNNVKGSKTMENSAQIKAFVEGIKNVRKTANETTGADGGYTVPEDIITKIENLKEANGNLESLVKVEAVKTNKGARTYKKRSQKTGFTKVGEGGKIGAKGTPKFSRMEYVIDKYAGIFPITNELLEDSDVNIYNTITEWIADESVATRNNLILEAIATKAEEAIVGLDGIKKALNVTLGQAFKPTSKIITNDDGLQYLDTLKDAMGRDLLKPTPQDPMKMVLSAGATVVPVVVIPNDVLETKINKIPFIIGDLEEGIVLFDRKKVNITTSNVAAAGDLNAFEEDLTLFRGIEREDVKVRDDEAFVNGYITATPAA